MTNNTVPRHEPEVEEAKARQLYSSIIDKLNEEQGVSTGSKLEVLAQVLNSIVLSVDKQDPGEGGNVITYFLGLLASLGITNPVEE